MRYPIILEKDEDSDYGVSVPDLPGCFSAGRTVEDAILNANEAILTHIEGMLMDDEQIPSPKTIDQHKKKYRAAKYIWAICEVDLSSLSERVKRINITLPEKLLSKIDAVAGSEGESRSGFLAHAALEYISKHNITENL